jgi:hypothetical protein
MLDSSSKESPSISKLEIQKLFYFDGLISDSKLGEAGLHGNTPKAFFG